MSNTVICLLRFTLSLPIFRLTSFSRSDKVHRIDSNNSKRRLRCRMKRLYLLTLRRSFTRGVLLAICLLLNFLFFVHASELPGRLRLPQNAAPPAGKSASPKAGIPAAQARANQATHARLLQNYGKLRLSFEANQGQTDARVKFLSRGRGYTLFMTADEAVLSLATASRESRVESRKSKAESPQVSRLRQASRQLPKTTDNGPRTTDAALGLPIDNQQSSIDNPPVPCSRQLAPDVVRLKLVGAKTRVKAAAPKGLSGEASYFVENDRKRWRTNEREASHGALQSCFGVGTNNAEAELCD